MYSSGESGRERYKGDEMTRLSGASVKEFKDAIEKMRGVYTFEDEDAIIVSDCCLVEMKHSMLEIRVQDKSGVIVTMTCEVGDEEKHHRFGE